MNERRKLGFEIVLEKFCFNYGRFVLVNLLFFIPLVLSVGASVLFYRFVLPIDIVSIPLFVIPASPFFSGVSVLCRHIYKEEKPDSIIKTYFKAVKENGLKFLWAGIITYVATAGCLLSVRLYSYFLSSSWVFGIPLFFSFLIILFFLFMFFGLSVIIPTFELKFKDALKNSMLMTFGELKKNFFTLISMILYLMTALMPIIIIFNLISTVGVSVAKILLLSYALISALLIPAQLSFLINFFLYDNLVSVMSTRIDKNNEDAEYTKEQKTAMNNRRIMEEISERDEDIDKLLSGDEEGYVFYKGKMIKRKVLRELISQEKGETL